MTITTNIPDNSVIVLDNAMYHNKQMDKAPTTASKKHDIKQLLDIIYNMMT